MAGYLIYHPRRVRTQFADGVVYHDSLVGNQDPYVWNSQFLHSFCHITQFRPEIGDVIFWVSSQRLADLHTLECDLVFVVEEKCLWANVNEIERLNPMVDTEAAFTDHYNWVNLRHHIFRRRLHRYTLKANAGDSFQPQTVDGGLLNLLPALDRCGWSAQSLRESFRAGVGSKPIRIGQDVVNSLRIWLTENAAARLTGEELLQIRAAPALFA